jgi:small subunit ribosomal protein S9
MTTYSTGKRKTSIAKVWLDSALKENIVNEKDVKTYFPVARLEQKVLLPQNILSIILKHREADVVTEDVMRGVASIKGNTIPVSFYEYINSLSSESAKSLMTSISQIRFKIQVLGGGVKGQAEATMYGIAKCLALFKPELQKILKDLGFLTRDSRIVERKKPGLRKARKKEQYSKR